MWQDKEIDLENPSIEGLIHVLRNRHLQPRDFKWNFTDHYSCAMGLAHQTWPHKIPIPNSLAMTRELGIRLEDSRRIFLDPSIAFPIPEDIARLLEDYLKCSHNTPSKK